MTTHDALRLIDVTSPDGAVIEPAWLGRAEAVHRELRPQLPPDYAAKMERVFADGGRMIVAASGDEVMGVAVWRCYENTFVGRFLYVDDLVTRQSDRSRGVGKALLGLCEEKARALGCAALELDSGTQRTQAHKFYFREGLVVTSFKFDKALR